MASVWQNYAIDAIAAEDWGESLTGGLYGSEEGLLYLML